MGNETLVYGGEKDTDIIASMDTVCIMRLLVVYSQAGPERILREMLRAFRGTSRLTNALVGWIGNQ